MVEYATKPGLCAELAVRSSPDSPLLGLGSRLEARRLAGTGGVPPGILSFVLSYFLEDEFRGLSWAVLTEELYPHFNSGSIL